MNKRNTTTVGLLVVGISVAALLGWKGSMLQTTAPVGTGAAVAAQEDNGSVGSTETFGGSMGEGEQLPPGHPSVGAGDPGQAGHVHTGGNATTPAAAELPSAPEAPALVWKAPATFVEQKNPNTIRIATYKVPRAAGDKDDAELSVTAAGGDTDANIARWAGQFEGASEPQKSTKTVGNLKVTLVELGGTYKGGMGGTDGSHTNWGLYAAIVETAGSGSYFFKMTGPVASVKAAKAGFDAMIATVKPNG